MSRPLNFLLVGVGGQGTMLAADVVAHVGFATGYEVKHAEVHGMSQRGGSVEAFVRWGQSVRSPLVGAGEVDVLVAFEKLEAMRALGRLRQDALVLINLQAIPPASLAEGSLVYPDDRRLETCVAGVTLRATFVDGPGIATMVGDARGTSAVVLGALSALLEGETEPLPGPAKETWLRVLEERVPEAYVSLNRSAFMAGRGAVSQADLVRGREN